MTAAITGRFLQPFYIDHKRLNLLTKTKLLRLKLINFSLVLIDERGGDKLKLKHWHKSEYRTVLTWMIVICNKEKLISNKITGIAVEQTCQPTDSF